MAIEVDTRGKLCPLPLIMLKQAIEAHPNEHVFMVLTDNPTSCSNLKDFIQDHGFPFTLEEREGYTAISVEITEERSPVSRQAVLPRQVPQPSESGKATVQIGSQRMGDGADELGDVLMLSFLNALLGSDRLPKEIICYNSGVLLALKGTATAEKLEELEEKGVNVILCGTCVDYFGIKSDVALGQISNMLTIYEHLSAAQLIIKP